MDFDYGTGAHISPTDERDWTLASAGAPTTYPKSRFIDTDYLKISNQKKIGACVGCTFEEIMRHIVYKQTGIQEDLSFRFVYAVCKATDGVASEGTYPSLAAKVIRKYGVPLAKYCPNDTELDHETFVYNRDLNKIPKEAFEDALNRKSGADLNVPVSIDGIKQAINYAADNNGGVAILRGIGNGYWTDKNGNSTWDKSKLLPIRVTNYVSGHEELLTGYDEDKDGRIRIHWINHWSDLWCDKGGAWEYLDTWLPYIKEIRCVVPEIKKVDNFKYTFTKSLTRGMKGADVVALQHVLKIEDCFDYHTFTGFYGDVTVNGVIKFQEKHKDNILTPVGLTHGTGEVHGSTIKYLNKKYSLV